MYSGFGLFLALCSHWVSVALDVLRFWPRSGQVPCSHRVSSHRGVGLVRVSCSDGFSVTTGLYDVLYTSVWIAIHIWHAVTHSVHEMQGKYLSVKYFFPTVIMSVCLIVCLCLSLSLSLCVSVCLTHALSISLCVCTFYFLLLFLFCTLKTFFLILYLLYIMYMCICM